MLAALTTASTFKLAEVPDPEPGEGELLIKVGAAGLCGPEHFGRPGSAGQPVRRGYEAAGIVIAKGPGTHRFALGDRVMGMVWSGHAELSVIDERLALPVPDVMSMAEAGGFDDAFCTSDDALFTQCELAAGDRLLVTGAAGGVGMAAVQLGRAAGATVVASVRDRKKHDAIAALGVTAVSVDEAYECGPFDVALELASGDFISRDIASLNRGGRLALIGLGGHTRVEVDFRALRNAYGRIHASSIRNRTLAEKALITERVELRVLPWFASGEVRVLVDSTFALTDVKAAYARFAAGGNLGKVVLVMD